MKHNIWSDEKYIMQKLEFIGIDTSKNRKPQKYNKISNLHVTLFWLTNTKLTYNVHSHIFRSTYMISYYYK